MTLPSQTPRTTHLMEVAADETWTSWFQRYGPRLLLCARQWTHSQADAEDVVQEAFVRFWRHQRHLPGEPMALLVTSVRRAAFDRARSESRRTAREEEAQGEESGARVSWFEPPLLQEERRAALERAVAQLPPEQREVLALKIWGELTFQEIATTLDIPANTAASRYRYALAGLRQLLTAADCHG